MVRKVHVAVAQLGPIARSNRANTLSAASSKC